MDTAAPQKKEYKTKGKEAFFAGRYQEALENYNEGLKLSPNDPNLLGLRAACLCKLDKYEDALADAENMVKLKPNDPKGHILLANAYFYMERWEDTINEYNEALKVGKSSTAVLKAVELALSKLKEHKRRTDMKRNEHMDMETKEVVVRDELGFLTRKRILVRRTDKTNERQTKYREHAAATKIQAVWRGHLTRKWLKEIEKDADKIVTQLDQKDKEGTDGVFQPRPIVDFWENVIEPEPTSTTDKEPADAAAAAAAAPAEDESKDKRIQELETLTKTQKKKIDQLESTIEEYKHKEKQKRDALAKAIKQTPRVKSEKDPKRRTSNASVKSTTSSTTGSISRYRVLPNNKTLKRLSQIAAIYRATMKIPEPEPYDRRHKRWERSNSEKDLKPFQF